MPQNQIISALYQRICKAIEQEEHFRVIVLLPQHPSGDFLNHESPRIIYHYEYTTICRSASVTFCPSCYLFSFSGLFDLRGGKSLYQMISQRFPQVDPSDFLSFHCLRNWGIMNSKVVSEQIYIHDKILIADDRVAIIGSANLNDRSMLGDRDSEVRALTCCPFTTIRRWRFALKTQKRSRSL